MELREYDDQIEANYLDKLEYVDRNLVAICGWEYGVLIALVSMSYIPTFVLCGSNCSDCSGRFMQTPQENMKNYLLLFTSCYYCQLIF